MESRPLDILARLALLLVLCGLSLPSYAQSPDSSDSDKSWTGSTDVNITNENATRINDSHAKSGNQTKDSHSVEALGPNGGYEPYLDTETETVKVNASTTRTIQRTYTRGPNGERALSQVTESESQSLPGGEVKVVRATSNPDINGDMQLVRREVADTKPTSPNAQETHTTVFVPSANGGLTAATQIIEQQTKVSDKSTTYQQVHPGFRWQRQLADWRNPGRHHHPGRQTAHYRRKSFAPRFRRQHVSDFPHHS